MYGMWIVKVLYGGVVGDLIRWKSFNALNVVEHLFLALSKCVVSFTNIEGYMSGSHEGSSFPLYPYFLSVKC